MEAGTDSPVSLIQATVADAQKVMELGRTTFYEAFAALNTPENMEFYLNEAFTVEKFADQLKNPESQFWVAHCEGKMIGYTKFNFGAAQTEVVEGSGMEIERIYVLPQFYGKAVGKMLYDKAYATAIEHNCSFIWLGVWEKNERGLKFYRRNGFVEFTSHVFQIGDDPQTDLMMKRQIP